MAKTVIELENVSKYYRLGTVGGGTLNDDIKVWLAKLRGKENPLLKIGEKDHGNRAGDYIWALRDLNLKIKQGEILGIIGANGAGKSTLLKILSRVTGPTSGKVKIKGRIGALLEVGTGFHPELTGRENVYLNGSILGMRRSEITRKFDEIVDFSGVEKYIDTPVKRYSSGMNVRLGFAVAAHLDLETLVIDEVLAVGDAEFQKRCLGKMGNVASEGRTVLFVSHNMGMINSLCQRAVLLDSGSIIMDDDAPKTIARYYSRGMGAPHAADFTKSAHKVGDSYATLLEAHIEDEKGTVAGDINIRAPFKVKMKYALHGDSKSLPYPNFHFYNSQGQCVFVTSGSRSAHSSLEGIFEATCLVPGSLLNNDTYFIDLALTFTHNGIHVSFWQRGALAVVIRDIMDETLENERQGYSGTIPGVIRPKLEWEVQQIS